MTLPEFIQHIFNWLNELVTLNSNEPFKTGAKVVTMVGVGVAVATTLATKTYPWLKAKADRRSLQKRMGAELFPAASIERSVRYYVTPFCQNVDPATGDEPSAIYSVKQDLFKALDDALSHPTEYKYLILLADSGMGKTSALINYYVRHLRRWSRKSEIHLVPLNIPDADERIAAIPDKSNTVLFLDALDEDTLAIVDHVERIRLLLKLTREFGRVVITCRTQFFPKDEEIPQETGILKVGGRPAGEKAEYVFHKLYLSPFTDSQVSKYLNRRYPRWRYLRRSKAKRMVQKIPNLTVRPMLLAHIDELVEANVKISYSHELYEEMIEAWLKREEGFITHKEDLRQFCQLLAVDLYTKRQERGAERVPRAELTSLANAWNIPLDDWKLGGRSLLNRDAQGNYKFAHRSIMEYLFVKSFTQGGVEYTDLELTDQMKLFLSESFLSQVKIAKEQLIPFFQSTHFSATYAAALTDALTSSKAFKLSSNIDSKDQLLGLLILTETLMRSLGNIDAETPLVLLRAVLIRRDILELRYLTSYPEIKGNSEPVIFNFPQKGINIGEVLGHLDRTYILIFTPDNELIGVIASGDSERVSGLSQEVVSQMKPRMRGLLPTFAELIKSWEQEEVIKLSNY